MSLAIALKADDDIVRKMIGREVLKSFDGVEYEGTVTAFSHNGTGDRKDAGGHWFNVLYSDGDSEDYQWPELVSILKPGHDQLEAGDETESEELGKLMGLTIKSGWLAELPQNDFTDIDGVDHVFCQRVGYNEKGGMNTAMFKETKAGIIRQAFPDCDVLHRTITVVDGHPSRLSVINIVSDAIAGCHAGVTIPNGSIVGQVHDHESMFGQAKTAEEAEMSAILTEKRVGGPGARRQSAATLHLNDFGRVAAAGIKVLSSKKNIKRYGLPTA
jgi:hypothetical protein